MARVTITYGDQEQYSVEFKITDGKLYGRYERSGWERRGDLVYEGRAANHVQVLEDIARLLNTYERGAYEDD